MNMHTFDSFLIPAPARRGRRPATQQPHGSCTHDQAAMVMSPADDIEIISNDILEVLISVAGSARWKSIWKEIDAWLEECRFMPGGAGFWMAAAGWLENGDQEEAARIVKRIKNVLARVRLVKTNGSKWEKTKLSTCKSSYSNQGEAWEVYKHMTTRHSARRREIAGITTQ